MCVKRLLKTTRISTPLGPMLAGATDEGICLLEFEDRRMLETQLKRLREHLKTELVPGSSPRLDMLSQQLSEYFEGKRREFDLPLIMAGTDFQKRVWRGLRNIPYGETHSYKEQAQELGNPNLARAAALANGWNSIAIIIPCHRVIGSDGKLVGYSGGLTRKQYLLDLETRNQ